MDEFRNDLKKRGDNTREASSTAQASGRNKRQATESQKANASSKKDALGRQRHPNVNAKASTPES